MRGLIPKAPLVGVNPALCSSLLGGGCCSSPLSPAQPGMGAGWENLGQWVSQHLQEILAQILGSALGVGLAAQPPAWLYALGGCHREQRGLEEPPCPLGAVGRRLQGHMELGCL